MAGLDLSTLNGLNLGNLGAFDGSSLQNLGSGTFSSGALNSAQNVLQGNGQGDNPSLNVGGLLGQGNGSDIGFGLNLPTARLGLGALGGLSQLYSGIQGLGLARQQLGQQNKLAQANLNNQTQTYNNNLHDTLTSRASQNGTGAQSAEDQYNRTKLQNQTV